MRSDIGLPHGFWGADRPARSRVGRRARLAAVIGVLVVLMLAVGAVSATAAYRGATSRSRVMCLCGCNAVLEECPHQDCGWGIPAKNLITERLAAGADSRRDRQVLRGHVRREGARRADEVGLQHHRLGHAVRRADRRRGGGVPRRPHVVAAARRGTRCSRRTRGADGEADARGVSRASWTTSSRTSIDGRRTRPLRQRRAMSGVALVVEVVLALGVVAFVGYPLLQERLGRRRTRGDARGARGAATAARSRRTRRSRSWSSTTRPASSRTPTTTSSTPGSVPKRSRSSRPSNEEENPAPKRKRPAVRAERATGVSVAAGGGVRRTGGRRRARQRVAGSGQDRGRGAADLSGLRPREPGGRALLRLVWRRARRSRRRSPENGGGDGSAAAVCVECGGVLKIGTAFLRRMWGGGPSLTLDRRRRHPRAMPDRRPSSPSRSGGCGSTSGTSRRCAASISSWRRAGS